MGNKYQKREFTPEEVKAIGQEYVEGMAVQAIMAKYSIGQRRVYAMIREAGHEVRSRGGGVKLWHESRKRTQAAKAAKTTTPKTPKAKRPKAQPLAKANGTESASEAQLNGGYVFSTAQTALPPTIRKAAATPRSRWIEVEDICTKCGGAFSIHAPGRVAGKAHGLWVRKHPCAKTGQRYGGENGVAVARVRV